jgi:hypothetical protein
MINQCEAVGGMRTGGETEMLGENLPQCHLVEHKLPYDLTWDRIQATRVGS